MRLAKARLEPCLPFICKPFVGGFPCQMSEFIQESWISGFLPASARVLWPGKYHECCRTIQIAGWVGTELEKHLEDDKPLWPPELGEPLSIEGSVNAQLGVIRNLRMHDTGRFLKYDGSEVRLERVCLW